ncbi:hypothetical protein FBEOM_1311 [Fusarium beomiforme]|uniref:WSC domain-containing protein n=1 Tax=Fusarium beomiforme TaxID=44412 RepID=A0A9P5AU17_9HYPO|nr:hypothetical protein FBEOM_1311 [Fusarium beomiforme]
MKFHLLRLVASAALLSASQAFDVTADTDPNDLASAIFGNGIDVLSASFSGASVSSGLFIDGPFGIGNAAILTSGSAVQALPNNGGRSVNNGAPGSATYCGDGTNDAAVLTADVILSGGFTGMRFELVIASEEGGAVSDPIGIFVNNQNYALDGSGNRLTATSPWLLPPLGIVPPNSVTSYVGSSPPFWIDVPSAPGTIQTVVIAICDKLDSSFDSALLIKAEACVDCTEPFRLAYVTTTTTLTAGDTPYTSTITASGTVSGTIEVGVTAEEINTTTEEPSTTTVADETTTSTEKTTTTTATAEESTTATRDTTTTIEDTTMEATSEETTTATTPEETTTAMTGETSLPPIGTPISTAEISTDTNSSTTSEELSGFTAETAETTTIEPSSTTTESLTIVFESTTVSTLDITTAPAPVSSTERITSPKTTSPKTTSPETTSQSDTFIDSTTLSSEEAQVSSNNSEVATSTDEPTLSLSSDVPRESTRILIAELVPDLDVTTTAESLESSVVQGIESSTDITPASVEVTSFSDVIISTALDTLSAATSTFAISSVMPSNLAVIGTFKFIGCLGSPAGYPSFDLIGKGSDMTTAECVRLGRGRAYIGIYQRSCYAADTLDSSETVTNGRCDLPCPGDQGLFCGGVVFTNSSPESRLRRRDAPPGILLTLYAQIETISTSLVTSDDPSTIKASGLPASTDISLQPGLTTESSSLPTGDLTITVSPSSSTESFVDSVTSLEPSVSVTGTQSGKPIIPPFPTIVSYIAGNFTRTKVMPPVITTVTYTVVDPNNPASLTIAEYCATLRFPPCHQCQYQKPPRVEMTTIKVDCQACGRNDENTIVLEIPVGAAPTSHETHRVPFHEPKPNTQGVRPKNSSPATQDSHDQEELVVVPSGATKYQAAPKPTFHHRPIPAYTPAVIAPDVSIVVSGSAAKVTEGLLMTIFLITGFGFLL